MVDRVGPWELGDLLGRGGMGIVVLARHVDTGQIVALKRHHGLGVGALESFHREVHTLSGLLHPGIVRIVDHGLHQGSPWYAMDRVDGAPLDPGPIPWRTAIDRVARLCDPLGYLHGAGVVHRDLKAANVMVRADGSPVLVDFGLACTAPGSAVRDALQVVEERVGTPLSMSPEQIRGDPVDARADLYALGCLLYRLLTGQDPFGGSVAEVLTAHLSHPAPPPSSRVPELPPALDELVLRLLAKRPRDRLGYAEDVAEALIGLGALPPPPHRPPRIRLHRPPFAGRTEAMAGLRDGLRGAFDGRGAAVVVVGPSGIGKTRLVLELCRRARSEGCTVIAIASTADDARSPLAGLREVVRIAREVEAELGAPTVGAALERLVAEMDPVAAVEGSSHSAARIRLYRAATDLLLALAGVAPVVVVFDDAQWLDEVSLGFLAHLERHLAGDGGAVLAVAAVRSEEPGTALQRLGGARIALGPLDELAVARIVREMLGLAEVGADEVRRFTSGSRGSPFFVAESLRLAVDEGWLRRVDGRWALDGPGALGEVGSVAARRVAVAPEDAQIVLGVAAIAGDRIDVAWLATLCARPVEELYGPLQELLRRRLLDEDGGRLTIAHAQTREAAIALLPADRRRQVHREIAASLADSAGPGFLAEHLARGGEPERALPLFLEAAREAVARHALGEAERAFREWLAIAADGHPGRARVLNQLGRDVLQQQGRSAEARELHRAAAELARDDADRIRSAMNLAITALDLGGIDEARSGLGVAIVEAQQAGVALLEAHGLANLAALESRTGHLDRARSLLHGALALHERLGRRDFAARTISELAILDHREGKLDGAEALYERAIALAREAGALWTEGIAVGNLAELHLNRKRLELAVSAAERALSIKREVGDRPGEALTLGVLAEIRWGQGRIAEARDGFAAAYAVHRETGNRRLEALTLIGHAALEETNGDRARARPLLDRARAAFEAFGDDHHLLGVLCALGRIAQAAGQDPEPWIAEARAVAARSPARGQNVEELGALEASRAGG